MEVEEAVWWEEDAEAAERFFIDCCWEEKVDFGERTKITFHVESTVGAGKGQGAVPSAPQYDAAARAFLHSSTRFGSILLNSSYDQQCTTPGFVD